MDFMELFKGVGDVFGEVRGLIDGMGNGGTTTARLEPQQPVSVMPTPVGMSSGNEGMLMALAIGALVLAMLKK